MKTPSASNAEAFVRCGASHVLPQHEAYHVRTERGTEGHGLIAALINKEPEAIKRLRKELPGLGFQLEEKLDGIAQLVAEPAYVVDVQARTSVFLGTNIGRAYELKLGRALKPYEIPVSLDLAGFAISDLGNTDQPVHWIRDLKFGTHSSEWQLYIQAMAVLWAPGQTMGTEVDAGFIHIHERDDGENVWVDDYQRTLYLMDLDNYADQAMAAFGYADKLEALLKSGVRPDELKTVEGPWCTYCGAYPHCPSKWNLAKAMVGVEPYGSIAALSMQECGAAWRKLGEIEKLAKKTKDSLRERMRQEGGFLLESGKILRLMPMPGRDSFDRPATLALLREKGVTQDEINTLFKEGEPYYTVREMKK